MKNSKFYLTLCIFIIFATSLQAQKFTRKKRYVNIGLSYNMANYLGDLVPKSQWGSFDFDDNHYWSFGVFAQKKLYPNISQRISINHIRLTGDDFIPTADIPIDDIDFNQFGIFRYRRNLSFRNDVFEASNIFLWDYFGSPGVFFRRHQGWNPYVFLGLSLLYSNPKTKAPEGNWGAYQGGDWVPLRKFQTEGQDKPYAPIQIAVPFGIGVKKMINNWWDVGIELGLRMALTDYLDDVSTAYIDQGFFDSDGFKGGPKKNDATTNADLAQALSDRSQERIGALTQEPRDPNTAQFSSATQTYVSEYNGETYTVIPGYGTERDGLFRTRRGDLGDNDAYAVLSIHVSYVLDRNVKTPRFPQALRRFDKGRKKRRKARGY